jgi:hypothetical protein
MAGAEIRQ